MSRTKGKVMAAGHICLDITPRFPAFEGNAFDHILVPGKLLNIGSCVLGTGGAVANTGLTMARLGVDVLLNGKVGDDEFGEIIKQRVGRERAAAFSTVAGESSSYSIVLAIPGIDRIFFHHPGTNDTFGAEDVDYAAAAGCDLFHFGYPPLMQRMYRDGGRELVEMFSRVRAGGTVTSLDMTLPDPRSESGRVDWRGVLERLLPHVDVFLPSVEEIAFMIEPELFYERKARAGEADPVTVYTIEDFGRLAERLLAMGAAVAGIKGGVRGYYLRTAGAERMRGLARALDGAADAWAGREIWSCSYRAERVASATGAGDATIGGLLTAMLRELEPGRSLNAANAVGWQNVQALDALSGIKDWAFTEAFVRDGQRVKNPLRIELPGWRYDERERVYYGPNDCTSR